MSHDASTALGHTLLSRVHSTGRFASACIAAVIVTMAALALAIGEFELTF